MHPLERKDSEVKDVEVSSQHRGFAKVTWELWRKALSVSSHTSTCNCSEEHDFA